ncbi:MAG: hypothetical protein V7647_3494 [Acidobacteriota bacterium]
MLGDVRRRWLLHKRLSVTAVAVFLAAAPVALVLGVIHVVPMDGVPLIGTLATGLIVAVAAAALCLRRLTSPPADRQLARLVEERMAQSGHTWFEDRLVTAVEVAATGSPAAGFGRVLLDEAAGRLREIDPAHIITANTMRRAALRATAAAAAFILVLAAAAPTLDRATLAARVILFPGSVRVDVFPGNLRIPAGTSVRVRSVIHGADRAARLTPVLTMVSGAKRQTVPMTGAAGGFDYVVSAVDRTFSYRVSAGRAQSAEYTVTALLPPRVTHIDLHYVYPPFAGLPPRDQHDGGDIYAPAGTRVHLRIQADKAVIGGAITFAGTGAIPLRQGDGGAAEADIVLAKDDAYRVSLVDDDGLRSQQQSDYFIRVMDDRPPTVRIMRPAADQQITPLEEITVEARADDDYGVAAFDLVYAIGGGRERTVQFTRVSGTEVERAGSTILSAEALGVSPGDVISYYARARDVGRGKRPTQATSDIFFLEVKPFAGEFAAAQSAATGQGTGGQVDALIDAQKQIIASTWNIERRVFGRSSPEDVKSVAGAQGTLRARAEQIAASRPRRRARPATPLSIGQRTDPAPVPDPISAAVEAMTRAVQQLDTERTKEALPHELAALNALLQAQAEAHRRELVQQQTTGGGNGTGRSGQDLTALFDKELQRQQKTNYETPASAQADSADRGKSDDALIDRIRDLARRQEDLSRRQSDVAHSALSPTELRRQLERLTREQAALRQEAEELAPRGGQAMREAVEQMAGAASELRRDDVQSAARDGARAAAQLRRAEARAGGNAGGAGHAAAEMQIEGHQIAQAQRRIASEAERLDGTAGNAASEARRRLADEKGRLADRVEELKGAVGTAGAALNGSAATRRDLDNVARGMRESAAELRQMSPARSGTAAREYALADAIEQLVRQLQPAGAGDVRDLSGSLDQARTIRNRLGRLERTMREAQAAARRGVTDSPGDRSGATVASRSRAANVDAQRAEDEYRRALERARQALDQLAGPQPTSGSGGGTPEAEEFSRSAPGTEAFKQDRSDWAALRKDVDVALDRYEVAVSSRLASARKPDRMSVGGSERTPDGYQQAIARYFELLAAARKATR